MTKQKDIKLLKQQSRIEKVGKNNKDDGDKDRLSSWSEPYVPDSSYTANDTFRGLGRYLELCRPKPKPPKVNHISYCEICKKTINQQIGIHYAESHNVEKVEQGRFTCHNCQKNLSPEEVINHHCRPQNQQVPTKKKPNQEDPSFKEIARGVSDIVICPICGFRYMNGSRHSSIYHPLNNLSRNSCPVCKKDVKQSSLSVHLLNVHKIRIISYSANESEVYPKSRLWICDVCGKRLHPYEVMRHLEEGHETQGKKTDPTCAVNQIPAIEPSSSRLAASKEKRRKFDNTRQSERDRLINDVLSEMERRQVDDDLDLDEEDGGKYLGWQERESGKFGSLPLYDDYGDEPIES